jgi:hypothetical protein
MQHARRSLDLRLDPRRRLYCWSQQRNSAWLNFFEDEDEDDDEDDIRRALDSTTVL